MNNVSHNAPKVKTISQAAPTPETPKEEDLCARDTRIALIQALIPLGLDALPAPSARQAGVAEELQSEVTRSPLAKGQRLPKLAQTQAGIAQGLEDRYTLARPPCC